MFSSFFFVELMQMLSYCQGELLTKINGVFPLHIAIFVKISLSIWFYIVLYLNKLWMELKFDEEVPSL